MFFSSSNVKAAEPAEPAEDEGAGWSTDAADADFQYTFPTYKCLFKRGDVVRVPQWDIYGDLYKMGMLREQILVGRVKNIRGVNGKWFWKFGRQRCFLLRHIEAFPTLIP